MPVYLPTVPAPRSVKPRLVRFGVDLTPGLGGPVQRVNRVGSRFAVDVELPPMRPETADAWIAARLKAEATNGCLRFVWPELQNPLAYDSVVVDGGGQAGTQLALRGFPANAVVPAGRFFSILHEDGLRLYAATDSIVASDSGQAVLGIAPLLRKSPLDGYGVHFHPVLVDGLIDGQTIDWEHQLGPVTIIKFTLSEFQ